MFKIKYFSLLSVLILVFIMSACGRSGQLLGDLPPGIIEDNNNQKENVGKQAGLDCPSLSDLTGPTLVSTEGCTTENATLEAAETYFKNGDFREANCYASTVFNESLKVDPNKPNTQAAWVAGFSRIFLLVEAPETEYLLLSGPHSAKAIFGPGGDLNGFKNTVENTFEDGVDPNEIPSSDELELLYLLGRAHELKQGHTLTEVLDKIAALVSREGPDLHTLTKAVGEDIHFKRNMIFPNPQIMDGDQETFKSIHAVLVDQVITLSVVIAGIVPYYDTGISSYKSLASMDAIVKDVNEDIKSLTLRGSSNALSLVPAFDAFLEAGIYASKRANDPGINMEFLFLQSGKHEALVNYIVTLSELKKSLENKMMWIQVSEYKVALNLHALLSNLPNPGGLGLPLIKTEVNANGNKSHDISDELGEYAKAHWQEYNFIDLLTE